MSNCSEELQAQKITEAYPTPLSGSPVEIELFIQAVGAYLGSELEEIDNLFDPNPIKEAEETACVDTAIALLQSIQSRELVRSTAQICRDQGPTEAAERRYLELVYDEEDPRSVAALAARYGHRPR